MQQHLHQDNMLANWKRNFNIAFTVFAIHQRGILLVFRKYWGLKVLELPCLLSLGLMIAWAAFSGDRFMWLWVVLWLIALAKRRKESKKAIEAGGKLHSESDGVSELSSKNERAVKLVLEPFVVSVLGGFLYWVYEQHGMPVAGLPSFLLAGAFTLPFVEVVRRQIWDQSVQSMVDARIQQEALMNDVKERIGGN